MILWKHLPHNQNYFQNYLNLSVLNLWLTLLISVALQASQSAPQVLQTSQSDIEVFQTSQIVPLVSQASPSVLEISQTSSSVPGRLLILQRVCKNNNTWWIVGLLSRSVGLPCFALSPSFERLIRGWNAWKFLLSGVFSLVVLTTLLFVNQSSLPGQHVWHKIKGFVVLILLAVYAFYYDKAVNGKPDILSVVSNAMFALISLSLSKLMKYGHEMGVFSFFLSVLTVQLWTINWNLVLVSIVFGFPLFVMHSSLDLVHTSSDSRRDQRPRDIEAG